VGSAEAVKLPVEVLVRSKQRMKNGEKHSFQVRRQGTLYRKGDALYVVYREEEEAGLGATLTTLRVEGRTVTLLRQGETVMKQVLVKGEEQVGSYQTPFGTFELVTRTSHLAVALTERGGFVEAQYNLRLGGEKSRMELRVDVKAAQDGRA
jgi:uncharacterized beta-barrel protein YwiB (DUF1934 family)